MKPNFNPEGNPFEAILANLQGGGQGGGLPQAGQSGAGTPLPPNMQQPTAPQPQGQPGMPGAAQLPPDPNQEGQNPGTSKFLISALQNIHSFIGASSDPIEIQLGRNVIMALTKLIQRDQTKQATSSPTAGGAGNSPAMGGSSPMGGAVPGATGQASQMSASGPNNMGV